KQALRHALNDVHLVLTLYSYPGDYITAHPTVERMAETIEKYEEDVLGGYATPKGRRRADVTLGEPIDVKACLSATNPRAATGALTASLEQHLRAMMGGKDQTIS